jgi:hypothetical protein
MIGIPIEKRPEPLWRRLVQVLRANRGKTIFVALILFIVIFLRSADILLAGPLRNWAERTMNSQLKGYTVHIARVTPHFWRLAFDLDSLILVQNAYPNPPVADFGALKFSLVARELLHFKVAGDLTIERPALHINLAQIEEEAKTYVSLKDRGWQSAVESIYPIKLNRVRIQNGSLLYLSSDTAAKPIQLTKIFMIADNVRNIAAAKGAFPSPVMLEGILFDTGKVRFKGEADFLREPYTAAQGEIHVEHVPLERLDPLARNLQLETVGGLLSVNGSVEYTPETRTAHLTDILLENLRVDYATSNDTKALEIKHAREAVKLAREVSNAPALLLQIDTLKLTNSQIGFVNKTTKPGYRLFLSKADFELKNLSNQTYQGKSEFHAHGSFMGSGSTDISGSSRLTASPIDLNIRLKLDDARLPDLNNFLLAHAGIDVAEGLFSVYTEITVKEGKVDGYLKPLIKNLKIYDKQKDKNKPFMKRAEMHLLQFLADIFKNSSTRNVATVVHISGPTGKLEADEWKAIRKLIGNGFSKAILPGFMNQSNEHKEASPPNTEPEKTGNNH